MNCDICQLPLLTRKDRPPRYREFFDGRDQLAGEVRITFGFCARCNYNNYQKEIRLFCDGPTKWGLPQESTEIEYLGGKVKIDPRVTIGPIVSEWTKKASRGIMERMA